MRYRKKIEILFPGDEIIFTVTSEYGNQIWALSNMTKKKLGLNCWLCGGTIEAKAYRPCANLGNRMERICHRHEHLRGRGNDKTIHVVNSQ